MRCVGNTIQMDWCPVVFEDMIGDTTSEYCQSLKPVGVLVWQADWERKVVTHRVSPLIRRR